jgi:spermidine/putrescine transport system permease protein
MSSGANDANGRGWWLIKLYTLLVYVFMFAPIAVVLILSVNASQFGGFPMTGLSFQWYGKLMQDEAIVRAFQTSLWIGLTTAVVCTTLGTMAALALVRYEFPGKHWVNALIVGPVLVPETVLGVGLLLANRAVGMKPNYGLLLLGHILLSLPYVVLVVQARLIGVKRVYEEAALSLGANRLQTFREITMPLIMPALLAGLLLAFTISFDNVSASVFWRPPGVETMPTAILGMLKVSISPEVNALGALMIGITVGLPLLGGALARLRIRRQTEATT